MDMTCRFAHDEGRNICLAGSECKARMCPWVHPARGFEMKLVGAAAASAAGADQSKQLSILVGRMLKARRGAQAAFARASDARLEASNAAAAAVEQARCVEILEQISAFDAFSSAPLDELLQVGADKRRGSELARRLNREIYRLEDAPKPALARREAIMQLLERPDCDSLVVRGDTGSGKSTQLPQYIAELVVEKNAAARRRALALDNRPEKDRKVLCTQPRKVAAVSLAERVNGEWSGMHNVPEIGGSVGYRVGQGGRKVSKGTVIEYVTEATLLQDILSRGAAAVANVDFVILDEAHERSVTLDILIGRLQLIRQETGRKDLKIIVTSATLDVALFSRYFGSCSTVEIPGRMFPVEDIYKPSIQARQSAVQAVVDCVLEIHASSNLDEGDILAFLPGQREVDEALAAMRMALQGKQPAAQLLPLFGQQEPDEQIPVFRPALPNHRKIVIATNVAETSVTIDGVCFVVDSGREKKIVYDAQQNVSSLREVTISRSSAQQRRGRAGRTRPGTCYRLYSRDDFLLMNETQTAEVLSQPVNLTLLSLYAMKQEPSTFPWLEAPDPAASAIAVQNLLYLEALENATGGAEGRYQLTEFGHLAAYLQMEPSRARVLFEGRRMGLLTASGDLVGIMSTSQNFWARTKEANERAEMKSKLAGRVDEDGDLVTMYRLYSGWKAALATPAPGAADAPAADGADADVGADLGEEEDDEDALERVVTRQEQRQRLKPKRNWKLGEDYCEAHHINKRTVALIGKLSFDSLRSMDNFYKLRALDDGEDGSSRGGSSIGSLAVGKMSELDMAANTTAKDENKDKKLRDEGPGYAEDEDQAPVAPDELRHLVLAGTFINIAVRISDRGSDGLIKSASYQHLTPGNKNIITGVVHPGSLLVQHDRDACPFISFLSLLSTSMMFLHSITCLDVSRDELIQRVSKVSPKFANDMCAALDGICSERVEVGGFSRSSVTGKRANTFRQRLSIQYKTSVQANFLTGVYTAYCRPEQAPDLVLALEEHRRILKDEAVLAVEEKLLAGSTRCVYARGGEVLATLFGQECLSVTMMNLPDDMQDAQLRALLEKSYGRVRLLELWEAEGGGGGHHAAAVCQTNNKVAKVTFDDKASAALCLANLQRDFTKSMLTVRPGGIAVSAEADITGRLEITWDCRGGQVVDAESLSVTVALLKRYVPLVDEDPELESFFFTATDSRGAKYPKAGFKVHYTGGCCDVERATAQWRASAASRAADIPQIQSLRHIRSLDMREVYECKIIVNKELYEWMATQGGNPLAALLQCNEGIKVSTRGLKNVSIFLKSDQQHKVAQLRLDVLEALAFDVFAHPQNDLLFSYLGKQTMARMSTKELHMCYIHWDHRSRTVRIYGTRDQRREGSDILAAVIDKLGLVTSATYFVHKSKNNEVKSGQAKGFFAQAKRDHGLEELEVRGFRVIPWGDAGRVEAFGEALRGSGWLAPEAARNRGGAKAVAAETDCGTCFCELEPENMQLQACLHRHCKACVSRIPLVSDSFPLKCSTCAELLTLDDLHSAFDTVQVERIHSLAHFSFKMVRGSTEVTFCPAKGCNMLIKLPRPVVSDQQSRAQGGLISHCDECRLDFCYDCSMDTNKLVPPHKTETCVEARAWKHSGGGDILPHRKYIENLLCPKCPKCLKAYEGFDGCCALSCGCGCQFCAICFRDCEGDAHECAKTCIAKNRLAQNSTYHIPTGVWEIHLARSKFPADIAAYLRTIPTPLRQQVFKAIQPLLKGLPGGDVVVQCP